MLDELHQTEAKYVHDMRRVIDTFYRPMKAMVPKPMLRQIFANLHSVLDVHTRLLAALSTADEGTVTAHERGAVVSSSFIDAAPEFSCYAVYCANFPYVAAALQKARANEQRLTTFLDEAERAQGATLQALLFRPVQRMCGESRRRL